MIIKKSYKNRFFTFLFFLVFLIAINASATTLRISIKVSKANIRLKPSTEAPIISTAPLGSILISNEKIGNWYKVDLPPDKEGIIITGYIHNSIVEILEEIDEIKEEELEQLEKYKFIIKEQNAEIRLKPSEESLQIFSPPLGANFVSFEKINDWYKVSLPPDQQGIVLSGYINVSSVEIEEEIKEKPKIEKLDEEKTREEVAWVVSTQSKTGKKKSKQEATSDLVNISGIGIKIGPALSNFSNQDLLEFESLVGLSFGGFISFSLTDIFEIQPELWFTRKGAKIEETYGARIWEYIWNFSYLELPLLFKIKAPIKSKIVPIVYVGPSFSVRLSGKQRTLRDTEELSNLKLEGYKWYDFGFVVGAGIESVLFSKTKIMIEVRHEFGFVKIDGITKNRITSFLIGFSLNH